MFADYGEFNYELMPALTERFRMTTASLILLFVLWQIVVFYRLAPAGDRWRWVIGGAGLILTTLVFIGILFLSYRFAFGERRMILPSYLRYAHTALLPMVLFVFLPLLPAFSRQKEKAIDLRPGRKVSQSAVIFAAILGALFVFETPHLEPLYKNHIAPDFRQQMKPFISKVRDLTDDHDARVWIYFPAYDLDGLRRRMFLYEMSPVRTQVVSDPKDLSQDPAVFQEAIANSDYLWFPIKNAQAEILLKSMVGEDLKSHVFRVNRRDGEDELVALGGVFN